MEENYQQELSLNKMSIMEQHLDQHKNCENTEMLFKSPLNGNLGRHKKYRAPHIEIIFLDNDISLALESAPPTGPSEVNMHSKYLNNDPFKLQSI
jgi:hypothetical protein